MANRLQEFFEEESDGHLRSIIAYEHREYDIVYLRDDVAEEYSEDEIAAAISESVMGSIAVLIYENVFTDDHGELNCLVQCFENVVEMNFVIEDGAGAAVAIDHEAMAMTSGLVADARDIVLEERASSRPGND